MSGFWQGLPLHSILGFQLLAPIAGAVAASIALPVLLFFYFLRLRRKPMRVSSTLFWEQAVADLQVNSPFRWIKPSLLLLIQLLALLSLLLAIARPALDDGADAARVAILIDASASMGARDDQDSISRLERAKAAALELVGQLPAETEVLVVELTGRISTLTNFTRNRGVTRDAIASIQQSDQSASLTDALGVVAAFIRNPGEDASGEVILGSDVETPPRVILFSDGAFNDHPEDRAIPGVSELSFEFMRVGPQYALESDEPVAAANVGITGLSARRSLEDPTTVRLFVRVQSTFQEPKALRIRCSIDGEIVATASPTIPAPDRVPTGSMLVPTSDATYTFDFTNTSGGMISVTLITQDALEADNSAWLVLSPPESRRILMIRPDGPPSNGSANLAFALETVFPAPREVRVVTASEAERGGMFTEALDTQFDLVVFDSVSVPFLPQIPSINFDTAPTIPGVRVVRPTEPRSGAFLFWRRSHPIMRDVIPDAIVIYRRSQIVVSQGGDDSEEFDPTDTRVVRSTELASDPEPLITLHEYGRTVALVVGFSLDQSNWWQDRSFPIFVQNAVDFLTLGRDEAGDGVLTTGDPIRIRAAEAAGGATIVDADGRALPVTEPGAGESAEHPPLRRAGLYELIPSEQSSLPPRLIAVNLLNAFESQVASVPSIEIAGRETRASERSDARQREIWSWFVLLALVLLTIEWVVFDRKMRV